MSAHSEEVKKHFVTWNHRHHVPKWVKHRNHVRNQRDIGIENTGKPPCCTEQSWTCQAMVLHIISLVIHLTCPGIPSGNQTWQWKTKICMDVSANLHRWIPSHVSLSDGYPRDVSHYIIALPKIKHSRSRPRMAITYLILSSNINHFPRHRLEVVLAKSYDVYFYPLVIITRHVYSRFTSWNMVSFHSYVVFKGSFPIPGGPV